MGKQSKLETEMEAILRTAGLDEGMVMEHRFWEPVPGTKPRMWRFDFAWPDRRLALEVHGGVFSRGRHSRPRGLLADMEKQTEAAILGWRMIYVSSLEIRNGQALDRCARLLINNPWQTIRVEPSP